MDRKKLFKRLTTLIVLIFIFNSLATKFYWYSGIWWFDMPMHFLGGLWLGICFFWLFRVQEASVKSFFSLIFFVLIVGVMWEIFELYFYNHLAESPFNLIDTFSDIFFDLAGGVSAMLYFSRKIMLGGENNI